MRPRFALISLLYLAVANSAQAVGYGWQQLPDGGIEFLFRVEPGLLETVPIATGELPRGIPEIRRIRVILTNDELPNEGTLPKPVAEAAKSPSADPTSPSTPVEQKTDKNKITGLPDPQSETMPTMFAEPPQATPIEHQSTGLGISTRSDHKAEKAPATTETVTPDETQRPSLEGDETGAEKKETTLRKVEVPESRPWLPLTGALVALFASLGANAYLAWIHQTLRSNYRSLIARMKGDPATA